MTDMIHFVSRADRDAAANLRAFVAFARDDLTVFGEDLDWDGWKWPGVATFRKLGKKGRGTSVDPARSWTGASSSLRRLTFATTKASPQ